MSVWSISVTRKATIVLWIPLSSVLWILYAWLPASPDHQMFDYIGLVGSWGGHNYIDSSDHNWPGAMLLHEVATRIMGAHFWSFRAFDFAIALLGGAALFGLLRSTGQTLAGWIVLPLYQLMYINSGIWFAGQRDIVAANFLLMGAAIFSYGVRAKMPTLLVVVGAIIGFATLIRPTYLSNLAYLVGLLIVMPALANARTENTLNSRVWSICWLFVGISLIAIIALSWGLASGNLRAWYEQAVLFNLFLSFQGRNTTYLEVLTRFSEYVFQWHWYLVFAILGLIAWIRKAGIGVELLAGVGVALTGLLSAIVQKVGFGYHLGAVLPILAMLTAVWLATVLEAFLHRPKNGLALLSVFIFWGIALIGIAKKTASYLPQVTALVTGDLNRMLRTVGEPRGVPWEILEVANFIRANSKPEDFVLAWSRYSHILYLSERRSTTHLSDIGMLTSASDAFSPAKEWLNQFDKELVEHAPKFIVLQTPTSSDGFDKFYGDENVNRSVIAVRELVKTQYVKVAEFGLFEIYGSHADQ
jgi:hypothetical protein